MDTIPTKEQIVALLYSFIAQRPGMEPANYGYGLDGWHNYRSESRRVTRQGHDARALLRQVELSGITAQGLLDAMGRAYSGRLTITPHPKRPGSWRLDYCTGQYFPTEYRAAVASVCATALWDYTRAACMPEPTYVQSGSADDPPIPRTPNSSSARATATMPWSKPAKRGFAS